MAHYSIQNTPENDLQLLKVPILGDRGVGKTSLAQQFICCECKEDTEPTTQPNYFYPVVVFNTRVYNLRLIDCPVVAYFPTTTIQEWTDFRGYSLRSASAFILVFDINSDESFQYIRGMREQIVTQNIDVPIVVVANKVDLAQSNGLKVPNNMTKNQSSYSTTNPISTASNVHNVRRDMANLVKKQWKGTVFIECSAKYNWHVLAVFKELMKVIDTRDTGHKPTAARAMQNALRRNKCILM